MINTEIRMMAKLIMQRAHAFIHPKNINRNSANCRPPGWRLRVCGLIAKILKIP
jgi:hypothetical protein